MDKAPELKNMVVIDSGNADAVLAHAAGESIPSKPAEKPAEKVEIKPEEPPQEKGESDDDYATRLKLTKEQHDGVTETIRKAIGKKHREAKEAQEFAKDQYNAKVMAEERAAKAERELQRLKGTQPAAEAPEEPTKPDRKDFKTDEEYQDKLIDWKVEQREKQRQEEQAAKAREDVEREREAKYNGQMLQAREMVPDFEETMDSVKGREDIRIPEAVSAYLFKESEKVPEVLYHLIKTPEVLESLWKMTPMRQVIEIGRIEGTLKSFAEKSAKATDAKASPDADKASLNGKQETATPSKPRAPAITPIAQGSESQVSGDGESFEKEFERYRTEKAPALLKRKRH